MKREKCAQVLAAFTTLRVKPRWVPLLPTNDAWSAMARIFGGEGRALRMVVTAGTVRGGKQLLRAWETSGGPGRPGPVEKGAPGPRRARLSLPEAPPPSGTTRGASCSADFRANISFTKLVPADAVPRSHQAVSPK